MDTHFNWATLTDTHFDWATLKNTHFNWATLTDTHFSMVDCTNADFSGTKNFTQNHCAEMFFEDGKPPKGIPEQWIPIHHAYEWIKRDGEDYRKLVNPDPTLTKDQINELEQALNQIPGGPLEDD